MGQETVLIALAVCLYIAGTASGSEQKILELHLVCDKSCYEKMSTWEEDPFQYTADLMKEVNLRFAEINILVVLVDIEIWNGVDMQETEAADDLYALRSYFGGYRHLIRLNQIWSDASILLTGTSLPSSAGSDVNGIFMTGAICMRSNAAGVVKYQRQPASHLAATVVHELGHALGMEHDNSGCCSAGDGNCIMAAFINQYQISNPQFSSCSKKYYEEFLKKTRSSCLADTPPKVFPLPGVDTCGNGVVEDGEDCDCPKGCACCDSSCKLKTGAQCWQGGCCNDTCQFVQQGVVCNPTSGSSCDLDDTCTGTSAECPDTFGDNGVACTGSGDESGYCYRGQCLTRDSQCSASWNPGFNNGKDSCYRTSLMISSGMSHCGPTPGRPGFYDKCTETSLKNYKCGLLQCEFSSYPGYTERDVDQARSAQFNIFVPDRCMSGDSYEWEEDRGEPLMVADGTKCGENLICLDTNCLSKESVYSDLASRSTSREVAEYCGDGVVSGDEECDCGALQCDCCEYCQLRPQGVKCRFTECKVCDGSSSQCPSESFMDNFKSCKDEGHCFNGNCVSLANSCKKYFGESATAARELYQDGFGQNSSEHNVGGYRLYDEDSGQLVEEEYKLVLDEECGVLLCESYNSALVIDEDGNAEMSKTFQSDKGWGFRYAYYNLEPTHHGPNKTYGSYYPLLADQGSPCTTAGGQPGFCNKHYLTMSHSQHAWYGYTKCTPVAEGTAT